MNRTIAIAAGLLTVIALLGADFAEAKRMGGGKSIGAQRQVTPSTPTAPSATPAAPSAPMQSAAAPAAAAKAAAPASGMSRWMGPIAGLAAGLGIAALLSHFGLGEGFANILMIALLAIGVLFLVRLFLAKRAPTKSPLQYAGATPTGGAAPIGYETQAPRSEGTPAGKFEPVFGGGASAAAAAPVAASKFPPGFEPGPFAEQAKLQFRKLQAGYDKGDHAALAEVMTPEMLAEVGRELDGRGTHTATEVMQLDAEVLQVVTEGDKHWINVHFKGLLREDGTVLPREFDEVWNLVKPVDGSSGWLLAGIQQVDAVA